MSVLTFAACLPTLRPVYVALMPKRFRSDTSPGNSAYPANTSGTKKKSTVQQSWGMSMLKSRSDDEAPLSAAAAIQGPNSHYYMVKDSPDTKSAAVFSSPHSSTSDTTRAPEAIRVEKAWDVEYSAQDRV